ncbi:tyrosine-type recombinase/integrase [Streptomyces sp. NPDC048603]|uniref:tyrosine-type recombinase/integrase n=1 Tax=Streptomyces sp. NPDC048603 TaxID=3365577 RepID=UPI00371E10F0
MATKGPKKGKTKRRFGAVRQYRSGAWTASYLDPAGVRRRSDETFETKTDAEVWLSQVEADLTRGHWRDPDAGAVNFTEYALKWVAERGVSPLTEELYQRLLRLHVLPGFGELDLDEITPPRVREWRAERIATTKAATTVAKSYRLLKAILETAADDELIRRNPCRIRGAGKEAAAEREIATVEQVDALANAIGIRWRLMVYLGAYGPMRPEELAELRRKDVNVDDLTIRVRKAAPELNTGKRAEGPTKSEAGMRLVVLPEFLREEVRRHVQWYAEKGADGLLFVGEKGAPFRRTTFGRKWRRARTVVGMPTTFRFYDLRHTGHTLSTRAGATLKDTMVRAGQSSEKAALIYQHSDHERQKEVAGGLDAMVQAVRQKAAEKGRPGAGGVEVVRGT